MSIEDLYSVISWSEFLKYERIEKEMGLCNMQYPYSGLDKDDRIFIGACRSIISGSSNGSIHQAETEFVLSDDYDKYLQKKNEE